MPIDVEEEPNTKRTLATRCFPVVSCGTAEKDMQPKKDVSYRLTLEQRHRYKWSKIKKPLWILSFKVNEVLFFDKTKLLSFYKAFEHRLSLYKAQKVCLILHPRSVKFLNILLCDNESFNKMMTHPLKMN